MCHTSVERRAILMQRDVPYTCIEYAVYVKRDVPYGYRKTLRNTMCIGLGQFYTDVWEISKFLKVLGRPHCGV